MRLTCLLLFALSGIQWPAHAAESPVRSLRFDATSASEAARWQRDAREKLFALMMGGAEPKRVPLNPKIIRRIEVPQGGYTLEELTLQTLPDRRVHVWMAVPNVRKAKVGAVLALHGHGGTGEEIVRGLSLYWYGRALAEMGYVVISPDIGQHDLQHADWTLMGERTWDALRCVDYLLTRPEVDPKRLAVGGLSLGGETTMYVAALDERLKIVDSSGWLTTVANMKNGHCPCFNFPGLEQHFDFSDIFACIAPRPLVLELGERERAPGGFPVEIGRAAFDEIRAAYRVLGAGQNVTFTVHPAGHVFNGRDFWPHVHKTLGQPWPWNAAGERVSRNSARQSDAAKRADSSPLPLAPAGTEWQLVWNDEFNGRELDPAKWDIMGDSKRRDGFWVKDDAYLDGKGNLILRTKQDGERFTSGSVRTMGRFEHAFGYWEVRCKLPAAPGHWPAFWLMSSGVGKIGDDGRDGTEIDIVEIPWRNGKITMNLHWDGYGAQHKSAGTNVVFPELTNGFHTFGLRWTTNEYVFFTDGRETWRTSAGGVSQVPEYIKLTEEIGKWAGDIKTAKLPDYFVVDYVRVYDPVPVARTQAATPRDSESALRTPRSAFDEAARRGEIARRCFSRALGVLDGWWATRDGATGLFPRRTDQLLWAPQDNAADMLPFLALTAHYVVPERLPDILAVIPKERELTTRFAGLPDWFALTNRAFLYADTNISRLIFQAAEYCKDGLVPMTEVMGRGPWTERMAELLDAIFAQAPVKTEFGALPADDAEVNGDLLQALARMHAITRDEKYFEWAARIVGAFCGEILPKNNWLPPHRWNFAEHRPANDSLNLNDHGNEIVGGLAEVFVIAKHLHPEKAERWREPLGRMFHRLLDAARNEDGLWFNLVKASTGEPLNRETPDTWGYALSAAVAFGRAAGDESLIDAARHALRQIDKPRYLDWNGADAYADSIEGSLYLLNRFPTPEALAWLEKILPIFLGRQRDTGIVEGWYGDGNYARTALLAALYYTQGVVARPWRSDLRFGAVRDGGTLRIAITADADWDGRLVFDTQRHKQNFRLSVNYPRLNEFPEWFVAEPDHRYTVKAGGSKTTARAGVELANGIALRVKAGRTQTVEVRRQ